MTSSSPGDLAPRRILFRAGGLMAVDKPAGLVCHATVDPGRDHLLAAVARLLQSLGEPAEPLVLHHRLDRDTSGVILLSRGGAPGGAVDGAFREHRVRKTYLAVVRETEDQQIPEAGLRVSDYLAPARGPGGRTVVVRSGGQPARTSFRAVSRHGGLTLVEARPETGRTHQIRVHLAGLGLPIVGDGLYGVADPGVKRLLLHALRLELDPPAVEVPLSVEAPLPRAFRARFPALRS